jgi:hypothetical protein
MSLLDKEQTPFQTMKRRELRIDEKLFLSEMKNLWSEYGNKGTDRFEPVWLKILETFNSQLSGTKGIHVCDSMCGTGKTLSAKVASAIFAKQYWNEGVIVVVRLKEQCLEVSNDINQIYQRITNTSENIARPFFTGVANNRQGGFMSDEMIRNTQVLVITHARYLSYLSGKSKNELGTWQRGDRSFRIVDESLDLVERFVLSRGEIAALEYAFKNRFDFYNLFKGYGDKEDTGKYKEYWDFFDDIQDYIGYNLTSKNETRIDPFMEIVKKYSHIDEEGNYNELYFSRLNDLFQNSTKKDYHKNYFRKKGNRNWKEEEIEDMMDAAVNHFAALDRIIRTSVYFYNRDSHQEMATGSIILPSTFQSMVILDATSSIDRIYSLFKDNSDQCHRYSIDKNVRVFKNVNLHFRPERNGLGIGETKASLKKRVSEIYRWANENFRSEDGKKKKVLFAGHKVLMDALKIHINGLTKEPVFDWDVIWYNNVDGKNEFRDYDNLVVTSLQYMPPHYSKTTILGFLGINGDLTDKDADGVSDSTLAVKLIQLFFRIATRMVIDDEGNCSSSNIYILLPGDEIGKDVEEVHDVNYEAYLTSLSRYLLQEFRDSMPGIQVQKWSNFDGYDKRGGGKKAGSSNKNLQKNKTSMATVFRDWLLSQELESGESCRMYDFEGTCVAGGYSFDSFKGMVANPKKSAGRVLGQLGFERIVTNHGKIKVTTFIKK